MKKYNQDEISEKINSLNNWVFEDGFLKKTFIFQNFSESFAFIARVALLAEALNHHPDWSGIYNKVTIKLTTHDIGGLSEIDFKFAENIEKFNQI
jgi:4a-hydroxytetrahydrobiopterin dehydratase